MFVLRFGPENTHVFYAVSEESLQTVYLGKSVVGSETVSRTCAVHIHASVIKISEKSVRAENFYSS